MERINFALNSGVFYVRDLPDPCSRPREMNLIPRDSKEEKVKKKLTAILSGIALIAGLVVATSLPSNAALRLPRTAMPACAAQPTAIYCIQSVSISISGAAPIPLTFVRSGVAVPQEAEPKDFWAPIATVRNGRVNGNNWWLSQYQRDALVNPAVQFVDLTPLWKTPNHPEQGAKYDAATKTWDINKPTEFYDYAMQCWDNKTNTSTQSTFGQCYSASMGIVLNNELIMAWHMKTADEVKKQIERMKAETRVDLAQLSELQQRPKINATYNATTGAFSEVEPYVIPPWIAANALTNGWVLAGTTATTPTAPAATTTDTATATAPLAPDTATAVSPAAETGRALPGRWTHPRWDALNLGVLGYDGIYVETKAFNEFSNHFFMDVLPTLTNASLATNLAGQVGNKAYAVSLDPDIVVTAKVRVGSPQTNTDVVPGVTVAVGVDVVMKYTEEEGYTYLTMTGQPVTVPLFRKTADCLGETGVAKANVRQLQALIVVSNDTAGFGVDGMSGRMYVGTNGVCSLSTPTWKDETKSFEWNAAAPHFAPDGTTVNKGFYKAVIPVKDAELLWGLTNPRDAATALQVTVTTEEGGSSGALSVISVKGGNIIIDVSGFEYSRPKLTIKMKTNYKPSKAKATPTKKTITCKMGKTTKKVTGTAPKCPTGYKLG